MDISAGGGGNSLPTTGTDGSKRRVCYFYDSEVGNYYYGQGHPMKPHRIRMTHALLAHYGLLDEMQVLKPHRPATATSAASTPTTTSPSSAPSPPTRSRTRSARSSFNLSIKGHAECVRFMRSFNVPVLLLGGGGYTIRNVARCWCYETGMALGHELADKMPLNEYYEYFGPDYTLHVAPSNMENKNTHRQLDEIRSRLLDNLTKLRHAPSVQFQERPPEAEQPERDEDLENPDERHHAGSDAEMDDAKPLEDSESRSSIQSMRVKREYAETEATDQQDGNGVAAEQAKGTESVADGVSSSKQALPTVASSMAIDEPVAVRVEPERSNKLQEQPAMHQKP